MNNRSPERWVVIDYTNHRGERKGYLIEPCGQHWGHTEWHREPQWLLTALDVNRQVYRDFAVKHIHSWTPAKDHRQVIDRFMNMVVERATVYCKACDQQRPVFEEWGHEGFDCFNDPCPVRARGEGGHDER